MRAPFRWSSKCADDYVPRPSALPEVWWEPDKPHPDRRGRRMWFPCDPHRAGPTRPLPPNLRAAWAEIGPRPKWSHREADE